MVKDSLIDFFKLGLVLVSFIEPVLRFIRCFSFFSSFIKCINMFVQVINGSRIFTDIIGASKNLFRKTVRADLIKNIFVACKPVRSFFVKIKIFPKVVKAVIFFERFNRLISGVSGFYLGQMFLQLNLPLKPSVRRFQLVKLLLVSIGNNILAIDLSHSFFVLLQLIVQRLDLISRVLVRLFAILHFFFGDLSTVDIILNGVCN